MDLFSRLESLEERVVLERHVTFERNQKPLEECSDYTLVFKYVVDNIDRWEELANKASKKFLRKFNLPFYGGLHTFNLNSLKFWWLTISDRYKEEEFPVIWMSFITYGMSLISTYVEHVLKQHPISGDTAHDRHMRDLQLEADVFFEVLDFFAERTREVAQYFLECGRDVDDLDSTAVADILEAFIIHTRAVGRDDGFRITKTIAMLHFYHAFFIQLKSEFERHGLSYTSKHKYVVNPGGLLELQNKVFAFCLYYINEEEKTLKVVFQEFAFRFFQGLKDVLLKCIELQFTKQELRVSNFIKTAAGRKRVVAFEKFGHQFYDDAKENVFFKAVNAVLNILGHDTYLSYTQLYYSMLRSAKLEHDYFYADLAEAEQKLGAEQMTLFPDHLYHIDGDLLYHKALESIESQEPGEPQEDEPMAGDDQKQEQQEVVVHAEVCREVRALVHTYLDKARKQLAGLRSSHYTVMLERFDDARLQFCYELDQHIQGLAALDYEYDLRLHLFDKLARMVLTYSQDGRLRYIIGVRTEWDNVQNFYLRAMAQISLTFQSFMQTVRTQILEPRGITFEDGDFLVDFHQSDLLPAENILYQEWLAIVSLFLYFYYQEDISKKLNSSLRVAAKRFEKVSVPKEWEAQFLTWLFAFFVDLLDGGEEFSEQSFLYHILSFVNTNDDMVKVLYTHQQRSSIEAMESRAQRRLYNRLREVLYDDFIVPLYKRLKAVLDGSVLLARLGSDADITMTSHDWSGIDVDAVRRKSIIPHLDSYSSIADAVEEIKKAIQEKEEAGVDWKARAKELEEQLVEAQANAQVSAEHEELQQQYQDLQQRYETLEEEFNDRGQMLTLEESTRIDAEKEVARLQEELTSFEVQQVQIQIEQAQAEADALVREAQEALELLQMEVQEDLERIPVLEEQVQRLEGQDEVWQQALADQEEDLTGQIKALEKKFGEAEETIKQQKAENEVAKRSVQVAEEQVEELRKSHRERMRKLQLQLQQLRDEKHDLVEDVQRLQRELNGFERSKAEEISEAQQAAKREAGRDYDKKLEALRQQIAREFQQQITDLEEELEALQQTHESELEELETRMNERQREGERDLRGKNRDLQTKLAEAVEESQRLRGDVSQRDTDLREVRAQLQEALEQGQGSQEIGEPRSESDEEIFQRVLENKHSEAVTYLELAEELFEEGRALRLRTEEQLDDLAEEVAVVEEDLLTELQLALEVGRKASLRTKLGDARTFLNEFLDTKKREEKQLFEPLQELGDLIASLKSLIKVMVRLREPLTLSEEVLDSRIDISTLDLDVTVPTLVDMLSSVLPVDHIKILQEKVQSL